MPVINSFIRDAAGQANPGGLSSMGPFLPVEVHVPPQIAQLLAAQGQPVPPAASGVALIDTGASMTCVHEPVLQGLGLNPIGVVTTGTASGPTQRSVYPVRLVFPTGAVTMDFQQVIGVDLTGQTFVPAPPQPPQQFSVLVGRNVLERGLFVYNGSAGHWSFAL